MLLEFDALFGDGGVEGLGEDADDEVTEFDEVSQSLWFLQGIEGHRTDVPCGAHLLGLIRINGRCLPLGQSSSQRDDQDRKMINDQNDVMMNRPMVMMLLDSCDNVLTRPGATRPDPRIKMR